MFFLSFWDLFLCFLGLQIQQRRFKRPENILRCIWNTQIIATPPVQKPSIHDSEINQMKRSDDEKNFLYFFSLTSNLPAFRTTTNGCFLL